VLPSRLASLLVSEGEPSADAEDAPFFIMMARSVRASDP
jgi:hypothetical protein